MEIKPLRGGKKENVKKQKIYGHGDKDGKKYNYLG